MFYVYLLKSNKDGRYYIGHSVDIDERLRKHNSGGVKATKDRRPLKLIGYEMYNSKNEARWREKEIKGNAHKRYTFIKRCNDAQTPP
ncbi:MAG: GIY-YIG nuclease family protein [Candidatus Colwellbacteria bacterium]